MSRSRQTLAAHKLEEFAAYCERKGWVREQAKGGYEVLRMRHPKKKDPLIVHTRNVANPVHLTTGGNSQSMVQSWIDTRKREAVVVEAGGQPCHAT